MTGKTVFILVLISTLLVLVSMGWAQTRTPDEWLDVNPFLNLLALALVIERLLEIILVLVPGVLEHPPSEKEPDLFRIRIQRITLVVGMLMGVSMCLAFQFGVLDEIFPGRISALNAFNHVITGLIAGSGSEPVHHMIELLIGLRERLRPISSRQAKTKNRGQASDGTEG